MCYKEIIHLRASNSIKSVCSKNPNKCGMRMTTNEEEMTCGACKRVRRK